MSSRFTRNLSEVKDINKLAEHVTTQNDLVQTTEGDVFVVTKKGFQQITGGADSGGKHPDRGLDLRRLALPALADPQRAAAGGVGDHSRPWQRCADE